MSSDIPIIRLKGNKYTDRHHRDLSEQEARSTLINNGFMPRKLKNNGIVVICFIFSFLLMGLGPIIYFWNGILKLIRNTTLFRKNIKKPTYVRDRRYRTGVRQEGYYLDKVKVRMPATEIERISYKNRGVLYLILGSIQLSILLVLKYKGLF